MVARISDKTISIGKALFLIITVPPIIWAVLFLATNTKPEAPIVRITRECEREFSTFGQDRVTRCYFELMRHHTDELKRENAEDERKRLNSAYQRSR